MSGYCNPAATRLRIRNGPVEQTWVLDA